MKQDDFGALSERNWHLAFHDPGTGDRRECRFVDGERADIRNIPRGVVFSTSPVAGDRTPLPPRPDGSLDTLASHEMGHPTW